MSYKNNEIETLLENELVVSKKNLLAYEAKIFYNVISKYCYELRTNNNDNREVIIDTIDVKKILMNGKSDISFERYKKKLSKMNNYVTIKYIIAEEEAHMISIMSEIKIKRDKTHFVLSYDLCERLKMPEVNFTPIRLVEISALKSNFAIKAYELCSTFRNLKSGFYHMPISKFNVFFDIKKSYKSSDVKRQIIDVVEKDINKNTRFNLKIEKVKKRNIITHYDFHISQKKQTLCIENKIENVIQEEEAEKEEIQQIIKQFRFKYNGNLDYILTNNLVKIKGLDCVNECLNEFVNFVGNANQVEKIFYDFVKKYGTEKAYKKATSYNNSYGNKPIQSTNYEQRQYDDDYFNNLYDNVEYIK